MAIGDSDQSTPKDSGMVTTGGRGRRGSRARAASRQSKQKPRVFNLRFLQPVVGQSLHPLRGGRSSGAGMGSGAFTAGDHPTDGRHGAATLSLGVVAHQPTFARAIR